MTPPIPSTSNAAATLVPISKEEMALLADEQCIQQETDDLECLLTAKRKQHKLAEKQKAAQMKHEEEMKVRARTLAEAVVAEVRQAAKRANKCAKDAVQKAMEELQRLQSPAKGKHQLVHHKFSPSGGGTEESIGKCYASEGEGHAGKGKGFTGGRKEWRVETEGE